LIRVAAIIRIASKGRKIFHPNLKKISKIEPKSSPQRKVTSGQLSAVSAQKKTIMA
jgi:hypothetical protein